MKLTAQVKDLKPVVSFVSRAIRLGHPVFQCMVLEATDALRLKATDLVVDLVGTVPAVVETGGKVAVPGELLRGFLAGLSDGEVQLQIRRSRLCLQYGSGVLQLPVVDHTEFPQRPPVGEQMLEIPGSRLISAFKRVEFAIGQDEQRPYLMGVYISNKWVIGADGACMSLVQVDLPEFELLLPGNVMIELQRMLGISGDPLVRIYPGAQSTRFVSGGYVIDSNNLAGQYPNVLPIASQMRQREPVVKVSVPREPLVRMLSVVVLFGNVPVTMSLGSDFGLSLACESGDYQDVVECRSEGTPLSIVVFPKQLLEAAGRARSEELVFTVFGSELPFIVEEAGGSSWYMVQAPLVESTQSWDKSREAAAGEDF